MEKQINLEEILINNNVNIKFLKGLATPDGNKGNEYQRIINSMKEAVKQALELANTKIKTRTFRDGIVEYFIPNKTDILDTINQVI